MAYPDLGGFGSGHQSPASILDKPVIRATMFEFNLRGKPTQVSELNQDDVFAKITFNENTLDMIKFVFQWLDRDGSGTIEEDDFSQPGYEPAPDTWTFIQRHWPQLGRKRAIDFAEFLAGFKRLALIRDEISASEPKWKDYFEDIYWKKPLDANHLGYYLDIASKFINDRCYFICEYIRAEFKHIAPSGLGELDVRQEDHVLAIKVSTDSSKGITSSFRSIDVDDGGSLGREDFDGEGALGWHFLLDEGFDDDGSGEIDKREWREQILRKAMYANPSELGSSGGLAVDKGTQLSTVAALLVHIQKQANAHSVSYCNKLKAGAKSGRAIAYKHRRQKHSNAEQQYQDLEDKVLDNAIHQLHVEKLVGGTNTGIVKGEDGKDYEVDLRAKTYRDPAGLVWDFLEVRTQEDFGDAAGGNGDGVGVVMDFDDVDDEADSEFWPKLLRLMLAMGGLIVVVLAIALEWI